MNDEIQQSAAQFGAESARQAAQFAPDAIVVVDRHSRIIIANVRAEEMFGYTSEELRAMDVGALIPEQLREGHERQLAGYLASPEARPMSGPIEVVGRRKDGSEFPAEISLGPARSEHGLLVTAIIRDITDRKRSDQALRQSEARLRALTEAIPDMMFRITRDGTYVDFEPASGIEPLVPPSQFLGRRIDQILPPEVARRTMLEVECALETRELRAFEYELEIDGVKRSYEARLVAAGEDDIVCLVRDITDRRRLEDEHARSLEEAEDERRRLRALIDTSPVGIMVAEGVDERVVLFNREFERILGFAIPPGAPAATSALSRMQFQRPDGTQYALEELPTQRALRLGETTRGEEMRFEFPDGRSVSVLVSAMPVRSRTGEVMSVIATVQDLTPIEELERLRNEFLGLVTHELRTPLTTIKGSAVTALSSRRPLAAKEVEELFRIIDEQADRLRDLVDSLLDMSRIEAGALSIDAESADLVEILEEARTTFVRGGGFNEVHIETEGALPPVEADRVRIIQVLINLLSNAAKFSPPSAPITVTARIGRRIDASRVLVQVRDRGRGILPERLSRLFTKFSTAHDEGPSGTGLGLAICKGIVEAHGGRIWAKSDSAGAGTTVSFTLPLAASRPAAVAPAAQRAPSNNAVRRDDKRRRVLVIDDDPQILRYLRRTLREEGFNVLATMDPAEATTMVEAEEPDIVLLDLTLPGTSGFELLERIREFSGVPVIILTASGNTNDSVRALTLGADDYITKPFSPPELVARVGAVLRRRGGLESAEVRAPYEFDGLVVNFAERRVAVAGREVALSATEYRLVYELATHAGQVLTHDQVLERVWGTAYAGNTEILRSFVRNVRRKLGDDARQPRYILTERQVGYRMPRPGA